MSIIFGIRKAHAQTVEERQLLDLAYTTDRYALDGTFVSANGSVGMGFQPYCTHQRSNFESQPAVDVHGNMLTFDGRLDNHAELCRLLDIQENETADSLIVLAASERWGEECFSRFIGDWALALWVKTNRSLYLARDHAGSRTLYFEQEGSRILWATFLETFFVGQKTYELDKDFTACYLAGQPIRELTPYKGIRAVPPSHYLKFHEGELTRNAHWQWMVKDNIHYKTDADYEEHFLMLFRRSVERRTGPGAPILAQLSGGMDSTSIVSMSDRIRKEQGGTPADLLDTVSYYDDSEPNWNEKPYFTLVEEQRGKRGIHIETSYRDRTFSPPDSSGVVDLFPSADNSALVYERKLLKAAPEKGYRSLLSGVGGDEVLGGVPTPLPELADHLVCCQLTRLFRQIVKWSLVNRSPAMHLFVETARFTCGIYWPQIFNRTPMPPWLRPTAEHRARKFLQQDLIRGRSAGLRPVTICNGLAWWGVLDALANRNPGATLRHEYRYPYLDRDLVEYLFAIPRDQLVLPGRRRSLMRRALKSIVPDQILERRRKAFLIRGPLASLRLGSVSIDDLFSNSLAVRLGFIDLASLQLALDSAIKEGDPQWLSGLMRTIAFERWVNSALITNNWSSRLSRYQPLLPQDIGG